MHAKCTECTKHKFLLKQLTGDRVAYQAQSEEFMRHLARQYADRCLYWRNRATSRLGSLGADCLLDLGRVRSQQVSLPALFGHDGQGV